MTTGNGVARRRTDMKQMTYVKQKSRWNYGKNPTQYSSRETFQSVCDRLGKIEDILGDEYELERLRALVEADRMIGKEVWAQERCLKIFREKSSFIQRTTIQYVSLLKGGDILCHTKTCAFTLDEIGKTVFLTRAEAEDALRREKDEKEGDSE